MDQHLETELSRLPELVLLGVSNPLTYPLKSLRGKQIALVLGSAVQNVLRHWKTSQVPTHFGWLQRLWHLMGMEKISLTLAGKGSTFGDLWEPLLGILHQNYREITCPRYLQLLHLTKPDFPSI